MKKIVFLFFLVVCSSFVFAQNKPNATKSKPAKENNTKKIVPLRAVIAAIQLGNNVPASLENKLDAAFGLACFASSKYTAVSFAARDSAARTLQSKQQEPTALSVAKELKADRLLFVQVSRIVNILRVQVASAKGENFDKITRSEGYSLLRFHQNDSTIMYDPSLLEALQRAFAAAEGDSMMYANAESDTRVFPAPPLAIVGIEFRDSLKTRSKIFDIQQQPVTGYDAVLTIFQEAKESNKFTVFDMDTRDTIYSASHLEYVENNKAPSVVELKILHDYGITYCITGMILRTEQNTILTLQLCSISPSGKLTKVRAEKAPVNDEDSIGELRKVLTRLTKKLLKIEG
ncbi:MAG: hypothetical protein HYZ54_06900 [Ignavibacteriae bacterium]|nr:hypothetical protein [Ignavibacteriota bacterium]